MLKNHQYALYNSITCHQCISLVVLDKVLSVFVGQIFWEQNNLLSRKGKRTFPLFSSKPCK